MVVQRVSNDGPEVCSPLSNVEALFPVALRNFSTAANNYQPRVD